MTQTDLQPVYLAGAWVSAAGVGTLQARNPATGNPTGLYDQIAPVIELKLSRLVANKMPPAGLWRRIDGNWIQAPE